MILGRREWRWLGAPCSLPGVLGFAGPLKWLLKPRPELSPRPPPVLWGPRTPPLFPAPLSQYASRAEGRPKRQRPVLVLGAAGAAQAARRRRLQPRGPPAQTAHGAPRGPHRRGLVPAERPEHRGEARGRDLACEDLVRTRLSVSRGAWLAPRPISPHSGRVGVSRPLRAPHHCRTSGGRYAASRPSRRPVVFRACCLQRCADPAWHLPAFCRLPPAQTPLQQHQLVMRTRTAAAKAAPHMAPALARRFRCTGPLRWSSTARGSTPLTMGTPRQTSLVLSRSRAASLSLKRRRSLRAACYGAPGRAAAPAMALAAAACRLPERSAAAWQRLVSDAAALLPR